MAHNHWLIKDNEKESFVHYESNKVGYTLCGLALDGDQNFDSNSFEVAELVSKKVNCPDCLAVIDYCKSLK